MKSTSTIVSSPISATLKNTDNWKKRSADAKASARILECLNQHQYAEVLQLLDPDRRDDEAKNLRGVCLLRLKEFEKAISVFRTLVLDTGGVWSRSDLPGYVKVNFALALFYGGRPSGAMDVLTELNIKREPTAQQFLEQVQQWKNQMDCWQRMLWNAACVAPKMKPVLPEQPLGTFCLDGNVLAV